MLWSAPKLTLLSDKFMAIACRRLHLLGTMSADAHPAESSAAS
jgi:hypothetical protein